MAMEQPMPAEGAQPQPQGAPAEGGKGGGMSDMLVSVDAGLSRIVDVIMKSSEVPDEIKQAFGSSLEAYRAGLEQMMQLQGGQGKAPAQGSTPMEAGGAPGAVPA